ncbi:MAG TPA: 3D domain-containing protein [Candidatus Binatia bacterium]|nr:3D domain-containing protein [Candidatus Binatia bacterium]
MTKIAAVRTAVGLALLVFLAWGCAPREARPPAPPAAPPQPELLSFDATAYSVEGKTAAGGHARKGVVAADPKILPIGTRIRVHDAGAYSGEYVVADTGRTIKGHEIDIYLPNDREAERFGRRRVKVEILQRAEEVTRAH